MLLWGFIAEQKEWHVYTSKSARHDGGILTARPKCGRKPFLQAAAEDDTQHPHLIQPNMPVNTPHEICSKCQIRWESRAKGN